MQAVQPIQLHQAARERYLNYAMSVITSRALPDVRDGLKPVQRRILYTMFNELSLHPTGRYRKCAAVVGEVMGKFHPHGDQSIYDALVRMAQSFSLRYALVDGQGNFGSLDGDKAAAMRYTECRLRALAEELLTEIKKQTVDFRPNYDGQRFEPIVLPAQFPQMLVNGVEGIAVGMATRIPPHNLAEIIDACTALIANPRLEVHDLMQFVKGPDFPTGGRITTDASELLAIYQTGQGTMRVRATWRVETADRRKIIVIDSVPYGQNKSKLIEKVGQLVASKKLPLVVGVRDESTEDVRIVLELKRSASPEKAMAFLYKHTPLECTWSVNLTALVPSKGDAELPVPQRLDLRECLRHWLNFRFRTVKRRFEFELAELLKRIHILRGFVIVFDALDEAIRLIRASEGKRDAAERLMDAFDLDELQTDAILEMQLYKLSKMSIEAIREELEEKLAAAAKIEAILSSSVKLWDQVKSELLELRKLYGDKRRTVIGGPVRELTYDEDAYIVKEDAFVVVTRDGWIKRQSSYSTIDKIRVRDEDEVGWLIKAHTRSTITIFGSQGAAYVLRVDDVPATTGYGDPLQRIFRFTDGERVVGVVSHDARHRQHLQEALPMATGDDPPPPYGIALTEQGKVLRFALAAHEDVSNSNGRKYARLKGGDAVLAVYAIDGQDKVAVATRGGRAMVFPISEVSILKNAGMGVMGIKLRDGDKVLAFELCSGSLDGPEVFTNKGRDLVVRERKFGLSSRGARGNVVLKRGSIDRWTRSTIVQLGNKDEPPPDLGDDDDDEPYIDPAIEPGELEN